jgi:hypothetical protein
VRLIVEGSEDIARGVGDAVYHALAIVKDLKAPAQAEMGQS